MSRYHLHPPGWPVDRSCVIGWDDALGGYFALVLDETGQLIAAAGGSPPPLAKLDDLIRAIDARLQGQLPPIQLTEERRAALAADARRPIVNAIGITSGPDEMPPPTPASRPAEQLGTQAGYLDAEELHDVLDGKTESFCRLESLYHATVEARADAETIARLHDALGSLEIVCHLLASMAQMPDILVATAALDPLHELAADAERILHSEAAGTPSVLVH